MTTNEGEVATQITQFQNKYARTARMVLMATIEALEQENSVVSNLALCDLVSMVKDEKLKLKDGGSKNLLMRYALLDETGKLGTVNRLLLLNIFAERKENSSPSSQK